MNTHNPFSKFYQKTLAERQQTLNELNFLSTQELALLKGIGNNSIQTHANKFIENCIGCFPIPLGVAPNVVIDNISRLIPMAIEETSVIAGLCSTAKWINKHGSITTNQTGRGNIGQVQFPEIKDFIQFNSIICQHKQELLDKINSNITNNMLKRGGGAIDINTRQIVKKNEKSMAIVHITIDCCDAMGANIISQACEYIKPSLEKLTQETANICILSNLSTSTITHACITLSNLPQSFINKILDAQEFAWHDPHRASTHNKGVLNGIDAVLIATGNDWRATNASIHAYSCRFGQYRPITTWEQVDKKLIGKLSAPIPVGTIGGVIQTHPISKLCLKLLKVEHAKTLAKICAAVGLIQNISALRALVTEGICKGHMKLHIDNLILTTTADPIEKPLLWEILHNQFMHNQKISSTDAKQALIQMRKNRQPQT